MSDAMRKEFEEKVRSEIPGLSLRRYEDALDAKDFGAEKGDYCVPMMRDLWTGFRWAWQAALEHAGRGVEPVKCILCNGDGHHPEPTNYHPVCCRQPVENGECCGYPDAEPEWGPCQQCGGAGVVYNQPPAPAVPEGWKLVPVEPVAEMQTAGAQAVRFETTTINKMWTANAAYRAMLNAAPEAPDQ